MKTGFKKLEYQFLVENRKIENTIFPHKMTKNKDHKERSFASNYFIFLKKFVSVWEALTKSGFVIPTTQMSIFIQLVNSGVLFWGWFFHVSILKSRSKSSLLIKLAKRSSISLSVYLMNHIFQTFVLFDMWQWMHRT